MSSSSTVHTYNMQLARELQKRVRDKYAPLFPKFIANLEKRAADYV